MSHAECKAPVKHLHGVYESSLESTECSFYIHIVYISHYSEERSQRERMPSKEKIHVAVVYFYLSKSVGKYCHQYFLSSVNLPEVHFS